MDQTILVIQILILVILGSLFLKSYFPSYFSEKGKNLATREDIAAITKEIEHIRVQYTAEIEKLRARLASDTEEQRRLREQQIQSLVKFYEACHSALRAEGKIRPSITEDPDKLSEQLTTLEDEYLEVTDKLRRVALCISQNHKVYKAASDVKNGISGIRSSTINQMKPIIKAVTPPHQADEQTILSMIDEFNEVRMHRIEPAYDSLEVLVAEISQFTTGQTTEIGPTYLI